MISIPGVVIATYCRLCFIKKVPVCMIYSVPGYAYDLPVVTIHRMHNHITDNRKVQMTMGLFRTDGIEGITIHRRSGHFIFGSMYEMLHFGKLLSVEKYSGVFDNLNFNRTSYCYARL